MKVKTRSTTILVAYALMVAFMSLRPNGASVIGSYDKLAHFIVYGLFALLAFRVARSGRSYAQLCIAIVGYSAFLEVAQSIVPGREMSVLDLLANSLGVTLGALLCVKMFAVKKRPTQDQSN